MGAPREERVYEEVTDTHKLTTLLGSYLDDYNLEHNTPLHLGEQRGTQDAAIRCEQLRTGSVMDQSDMNISLRLNLLSESTPGSDG